MRSRTGLLWSCLLLAGCGCGDDDDFVAAEPDAGDEDAGGTGREVRVPAQVDAAVGAVVTVEVTLAAGGEAWNTTITASGPRFDWIEGEPADGAPVAIADVQLDAGHQQAFTLRVQTLLTWNHVVTLTVDGEDHDIPIEPRLTTPLVGVEGLGCDGPHELAYGPSCGSCGAETTDAECAASEPLESCHPVGLRLADGADEEVARAACDASAALPIEFTRSLPASFWTIGLDQSENDLSELEWVSATLETQLRTRPLPTPGYLSSWMYTCGVDCLNANGTFGPYDQRNAVVFGGLENLGRDMAGLRGSVGIQLAEAAETLDLFCPCLADGVPCSEDNGPSQAACLAEDPVYSDELALAYGANLAAIALRVAEGVHETNPDGLVISSPLDDPERGLSALTRHALELDMDESIDALGVISTPLPDPTWIEPLPDCAANEAGCETAPPFTDWGEVSARDTWQAFDEACDPSELVATMVEEGWGTIPLFVSSLRAGFHGTSPREAIAALRAAAILTSSNAAGFAFAHQPASPEPYVLLARTFSGAKPLTFQDTPTGYDDLVVRFYSRDGQDVVVLWNDAAEPRTATFSAVPAADFFDVRLTRVRGDGADLDIATERLETPDGPLEVAPLSEVVILTVDAGRTDLELDWLADLTL